MPLSLKRKHLPLAATSAVLLILYVTASVLYYDDNFFTRRMAANIFADNAYLGIIAVGMTFVILTGGIDLSVGSVLAFTTILIASLVEGGTHPLLAMLLALAIGTVFGMAQGALVHIYQMPPFLVTLGGMFLARGMSFVVSEESVGIEHALYDTVLDDLAIPLGCNAWLPLMAVVFIAVLLAAHYLAHFTRFGRNVYAIGGSEESAVLMGLSVGFTKITVYALNGFCAALGGIAFTFFTVSGNPTFGVGLELDAIATVVIGGTLLSGGVGYLGGTLLGLLILGTIRAALDCDGRLDSSWLRIAIGCLLLVFILLQRLIVKKSVAH